MLLLFLGSSVHADNLNNEALALDLNAVKTSWNLTFLFTDKESASLELQNLRLESQRISDTYRPKFTNLTGQALLQYIRDEDAFDKRLSVLETYADCQNSLNVNDAFFPQFLSDVQDLYTKHYASTSFVEIRLKSLSLDEWKHILREEPELGRYQHFLEDTYVRYAQHRPRNESHAAYIADLGNKIAELETDAQKEITNNITVAGNITLSNGRETTVNSRAYSEILFSDANRENRKKCYDRRFYHTINQSDAMAEIYSKKARMDDLLAREQNYSNAYHSKMFRNYLTAEQIEEMNSVLKERKSVFDSYYELRKKVMNLDELKPYDLYLQLMKDPGKRCNYTDALVEIYGSYAGMAPVFKEIFLKEVTGNYTDVYPNQAGGKLPGGYTTDLAAQKLPSLIFMNYKGLIDSEKTFTHEMGHAISFYLMGNSVDYVYCGGTDFELEVPAIFNEELFVDYALENFDHDRAVAVLAGHISNYENTLITQPKITEFERQAHRLIDEKGNASGKDLNSLWSQLDKEYRSDKVEWYKEDSAGWASTSHIFMGDNFYNFNYALSEAVALALFKKYKEDPEEFNKNYIAYLSCGTTLTPSEKLKRYFGIEIDRRLFEDAMDMVAIRIKQLEELENIRY